MGGKEERGGETSPPAISSAIRSIFMHSDGLDLLLMLLGFLGALCDGGGTPAMLIIMGKIMNNLGSTSNLSGPEASRELFDEIDKNVVIVLYLASGTFVACFLEGYCWSRTGERQASSMRSRYLRAILRQDIGYFDLQPDNTAQVISSVSSDSLVIQDFLAEKLPNFVMNVSAFFMSYAAALALMWRLAVVALPTILLLMIPGMMYGKILLGLARKIQKEYDKAGTIVEQAISSVRTVFSFVGEAKTMARFSGALEGSLRLGLKQGLAKGLAIGSNGITFSIWAFMAWYGSKLVMYHGAQGGTIFAASASIILGGLSLGSGLSNVKYFSEAASAAERVMQVINRIPRIDSDSSDGIVLQDVKGEVELRGVEFAYPSRPDLPVFESFDLRVPAGRTLALVGGSGSGKSTVIALLERFYDPAKGEILLDGVDVRSLSLKWLRSQMGLVSQEPTLFAASIKENILFGKVGATEEEVVAAAKAANAHNFVSQLPRGYDTQVGERGVQMSGGQKQRIAIARAIIKSPKILLLDEATSALDSESERVVQAALDLAAVGRTTVVIAHRLSTVRNADSIAVLQSGRVVELGPHDRLSLDPDGPYSTLLRLQEQLPLAFLADTRGGNLSGRLSSARLSHSSSVSSFRHSQGDDPAGVDEPAAPPVPSFRRLLRLNLPEWRQASIGCTCATLFGVIQPLYAFALASTIFVYFLEDDGEIKSEVRKYALIFVGLSVFSLAVNVGQHYSFASMGERLTKRVRERMLEKILSFEAAWFDEDRNSTGAVCSRLAKDAGVVRSLVGDRMALLIQAASAVTVACALGLAIAWRLALVMIAVQPLIIACFYFKKVMLKNMSGKAIGAQEESSKLAAEAVSNVRTITSLGIQDLILNLFQRAQDGPRREATWQSLYAGFGLATSNSLMQLTWALDFWYGARLASQGHVTAKEVFQTTIILVSTGRVIAEAGTMTNDLAKGADAVGSVFDVLDRKTRIDPEAPGSYVPPAGGVRGEVEFRDVHFAYPSRLEAPVFRGFSLLIQAGRSTALVGQSGSGKSTVVALIERFYDPDRGSVMVDRRDIRSYRLRALRRHIALVGQEPVLFSGSIRENIAYGAADDQVTMEEEVERVARAANAHEFVSGLKDGYETAVGERGVQLSGGQKQRIAIARAIVRGPAVLLLDEATSALDSRSESAVQEALERVMVGRTSVVVAHRLSTVRGCDAIAVLEKGAVVEKGTHAELLGKGPAGAYHKLVVLQQRQH